MDDYQIKIPKGAVEGVVTAQIQAAVMEALGRDPTSLVREVVRQAMNQKSGNYGRKTIFEEAVHEQIRGVANEAFKEWLEEQRGAIRKEVREQLGKAKFADKILSALKDSLYVNVSIRSGE